MCARARPCGDAAMKKRIKLNRDLHWFRLAGVACAATLVLAGGASAAAQGPAVMLSGTSHETTTWDVPGASVSTSRCEISSDPEYGTQAHPIELGGNGHPAAREIAYLSALRGPGGQGLHFGRLGSRIERDVPVDLYQVDYSGLAEPRTIYIDGYRSAPVKAPPGWICGLPLNVPFASADPFLQLTLMRLAVRLGEDPVAPVSLDPDGSAHHGVVFDHVRLVALAARLGASLGTPLDYAALPAAIARPHLVVVAFPMMCQGSRIAPRSIVYRGGTGPTAPVVESARNERIADLVPGFSAPADALAVSYDTPWLFDDAQVSVQYERPCGSERAERVFAAQTADGEVIQRVKGHVPPQVTVPADGARV